MGGPPGLQSSGRGATLACREIVRQWDCLSQSCHCKLVKDSPFSSESGRAGCTHEKEHEGHDWGYSRKGSGGGGSSLPVETSNTSGG